MTYELAKELKDTGFPQIRKAFLTTEGLPPMVVGMEDPKNEVIGVTYGGVQLEEEAPYEPTLSELIEACDLGLLECLEDFESRKEWAAYDSEYTLTPDEIIPNICGKGATPEEAVARLWLALKAAPNLPVTGC